MNELEKFEKLLRIGQQMSNVCYNLSQCAEEPLSQNNADLMRSLSLYWSDVCIDAHREVKAIAARAVPVFDPILLGC